LISPILVVEIVERENTTLFYKAAFAEFFSPIGWANLFIAVGEIAIGIDTLSPRTVVVVSTLEIFLKILGLSKIF
jgi:hypothetical protein